jgi:hypothetical protein
MKLLSVLSISCAILGGEGSLVSQQTPIQAMVASVVTCVSVDAQRQQCEADTSAGVVMLRQTSATNCLLGRNWGYDGKGVWVSEGCGGEFATGSTSRVASQSKAEIASSDQKQETASVTTGENPNLHYTGYLNPYGSLRNIVSITNQGRRSRMMRVVWESILGPWVQ